MCALQGRRSQLSWTPTCWYSADNKLHNYCIGLLHNNTRYNYSDIFTETEAVVDGTTQYRPCVGKQPTDFPVASIAQPS